jgi:hypothetical protein
MAVRTSSARTANCTLTTRRSATPYQGADLSHHRLQRGLCAAGRYQLEPADDNNAFHAKTIVMDLDGSISTEVAIIANKQEYDDIVTWGLADSNDGKPVSSWAFSVCGLIPKGAKNIDVAKGLLKYLIQPEVCNEYLKTGLGRRSRRCRRSSKTTPGGWRTRTAKPIRRRLCFARPSRYSGPTIPPMPMCRTSMSGRRPGPR